MTAANTYGIPQLPLTRRRGKIYIRVSSVAGRVDLNSPEIQERTAREKAEHEGIDIIEVIIELDLSGRKFNKRKIAAIIEEVRRGEYEYVVLWKWNRFGRNLKDSLIHLDELKAAGGKAISATEPGDGETMMGRFGRNQMLLIAELQSDMIGEGWKETHLLRRSNGIPPTGQIGFGYHIVKETNEDGKTRKIVRQHPVNGPAIGEYYRRWLDGERGQKITDDMAKRGIVSRGGKLIRSPHWLAYMDQGAAAGLLRVRKPGAGTNRRITDYDFVPGSWDPIIEPEVWEAYLKRRTARLGGKRTSNKAKYSVSGMLVCHHCRARTLNADPFGPNFYDVRFRCFNRSVGLCSHMSVSLRACEDAVRNWLRQRAHLITSVEEEARRLAHDHQVTDEADKLEKKITTLEARVVRLVDLYEDGGIEKEEYRERREARDQEIREAEIRLSDIRRKTSQNLPASFYLSLDQNWGDLTQDRIRHLLNKVIDFIMIYPSTREGGRFDIVPFEKLDISE